MSNADPRGKFVWHELLTSRHCRRGRLLSEGRLVEIAAVGEGSVVHLVDGQEQGPIGGVAALDDGGSGRAGSHTSASKTCEATVAQAKSMGAKVLKDVTEMPEHRHVRDAVGPAGRRVRRVQVAEPVEQQRADRGRRVLVARARPPPMRTPR